MIAVRKKTPGLTQQKLAEELGKHQSFVAKYERGDRRVDVTEFITICRALGTDPIRILKALIRRFP